MKSLNNNSVGLTLGSFLGFIHVIWIVLVWTGVAQFFLDFVFSLHSIRVSFIVTDFDAITSVTLVMITFVVGYIFGWIFSAFWNVLKSN